MKKLAVLIILLFSSNLLYSSDIVKIKLFDGDTLTGKLDLPANNNNIKELVIYIPGTGPNTYLNHRKIGTTEFNYYDLFVEEFNKRGVGFFSYNQRGVDNGNEPPYYDKVNQEKYKKYLPENGVKDIVSIINHLKLDKRLKNAKVILLGWSEGTILAAMAADEYKSKKIIDGLFLCGYVNENLYDVIKWQFSGEPSMIFYRKYFDKNNDKVISRDEFLSDDSMATKVRTALQIENQKEEHFKSMDKDSNNKLTKEDFKILVSDQYQFLLKAIDGNDDKWIWEKYFRITSLWCKQQFKLEPNKTRLLRIDIPIYIFHGDEDAHCPVEGVFDIKNEFAQHNKTNLQCFDFKGEDHDLNYLVWAMKKNIPDGIQKIFDISEELAK